VTAQASFIPRNGLVVPAPAHGTPEAVDAVVATAAAAAEPMAAVPPATRAGWLTAIADEADAEPLAALADDETALGLPRLTGELAGAARALRFYGSVAAGAWLAGLAATLSKRCGRVVVNGWPTGVALGWAQQHGGPWRVPRRVDGVAA
jgi:NADP-dependent aldehyde dehydrogenase